MKRLMHPSSSLYHVLFYNNNGCTKIHAEQGYLVVSSWINPTGQSGHVATLSVGSNRGKGREYANIGPAKYSGFTTFGASYGKNKRPHVQHHVYMRSSCKPVQIIVNKPN